MDIVGHDAGQVVLAAEAKWTNQAVGLDVLRTLERRVALLPNVHPECQLALFSKSGFTSETHAARTPNVALFELPDLLGR